MKMLAALIIAIAMGLIVGYGARYINAELFSRATEVFAHGKAGGY